MSKEPESWTDPDQAWRYCDQGGFQHRWDAPTWECKDCGRYQDGCKPSDVGKKRLRTNSPKDDEESK